MAKTNPINQSPVSKMPTIKEMLEQQIREDYEQRKRQTDYANLLKNSTKIIDIVFPNR